MRAGILGGTFDPPHVGHLIVAQDAALALGLDRIVFIPAAQPPHKLHMPVTPAHVRARMLELAVGDDDRFRIDLLELERAGASFTVQTLRELHEREPDTEWTLLIGVDQYREFGTWREPDTVRQLARLAVVSREGGHAADGDVTEAGQSADAPAGVGGLEGAAAPAIRAPGESAGRLPGGAADIAAGLVPGAAPPRLLPPVREIEPGLVQVRVTRIDVSSTMVRDRVAAGLPIRYLVPAAVEGFILEQRLYSRNGAATAGYDAGHADIRG